MAVYVVASNGWPGARSACDRAGLYPPAHAGAGGRGRRQADRSWPPAAVPKGDAVTTFRLADSGFWDSEPELLRPLQAACQPFGLRIRHFVMGDADDAATPTAAVLEMPPGYVL